MSLNKKYLNKANCLHTIYSYQRPPPIVAQLCLGCLENTVSGICAFFGHRDTPYTVELENKVEEIVRALIAKGVDEFWVCYEGNFDWISRMVMSKIKAEFKSEIYVCFVCAYNPDKYSKTRRDWLCERYEIIYPPEVADGPQKFAIERRNKYIVDNVGYLICYVKYKTGGAYRALIYAKKCDKKIINIADLL